MRVIPTGTVSDDEQGTMQLRTRNDDEQLSGKGKEDLREAMMTTANDER